MVEQEPSLDRMSVDEAERVAMLAAHGHGPTAVTLGDAQSAGFQGT